MEVVRDVYENVYLWVIWDPVVGSHIYKGGMSLSPASIPGMEAVRKMYEMIWDSATESRKNGTSIPGMEVVRNVYEMWMI